MPEDDYRRHGEQRRGNYEELRDLLLAMRGTLDASLAAQQGTEREIVRLQEKVTTLAEAMKEMQKFPERLAVIEAVNQQRQKSANGSSGKQWKLMAAMIAVIATLVTILASLLHVGGK